MSSIYSQLKDVDVNNDLQSPALLPTEHLLKQPKLTGIKLSIFFSLLIGVLALAGMGFLYYSLETANHKLEALGSSHVALSERTSAMANAVSEQRSEMEALRGEFASQSETFQKSRSEMIREIEKRRIGLENLQKKLLSIYDQALKEDYD